MWVQCIDLAALAIVVGVVAHKWHARKAARQLVAEQTREDAEDWERLNMQ